MAHTYSRNYRTNHRKQLQRHHNLHRWFKIGIRRYGFGIRIVRKRKGNKYMLSTPKEVQQCFPSQKTGYTIVSSIGGNNRIRLQYPFGLHVSHPSAK